MGEPAGPPADPLAQMIEATFKEARQRGVSVADVAQLLAQSIRGHLSAEAEQGLARSDVVMVQSLFGAHSGQPLVQCRVGFEQWEWDLGNAREHVTAMQEAIEAATSDAMLYRWLTLGRLGLPMEAAAVAVGEMRRFRGDAPREDWRVPDE